MDERNAAELEAVRKDDIVVLRDFHTMEANGAEYTGPIKNRFIWQQETNFRYFGFELGPAEGIELLLLVRFIGDKADCRLYRKWYTTLRKNTEVPILDGEKFNEHVKLEPAVGEGQADYYLVPPFPFWGVEKSDATRIALAEYIAPQAHDDHWARHLLVEWYAHIGTKGGEGLLSMWMGWGINFNDFDIFSKGGKNA